MDEITLMNPSGYDLSETILIDYRLYYAKHHACQTCGDSECVQYWVEGNGVSKCDIPLLNDVLIYGKLFGRCKDCKIEDPKKTYFYRPRFDLFPIVNAEYGSPMMNRYDPNRDYIISDSTSMEWSKIR
jgi:hypothetical protein